jgi:hypothetical protein
MAKPPEPVEDLVRDADTIVVAEVAEVMDTGPQPPKPPGARPGMTGAGTLSPRQTVKLKVERTLKGKGAPEMVVEKPEAQYLLKPGNRGPFCLAKGQIIGRYGPDTRSVDAFEKVLVD